MAGMRSPSETVGDADQGQGMRLFRTSGGIAPIRSFPDALQDRAGRDRAIGAHVVRRILRHLPEYGPPDLHGCRIELALDAPGAVVSGATLYRINGGPRPGCEDFTRLLPDVLHPRVAGYVVGDLAQRRVEVFLEQTVLVAQRQVLEGVVHRLRDRLDVRVLGKDERQLALEHERARRHRR